MASAFCTAGKKALLDAVVGGTWKAALYTSSATLDASTPAYTATNEVASSGGYTAGGMALTGAATGSGSGTAWLDFNDVTWTFTNDDVTWTPLTAGISICFYVDGIPVDVTVDLTGVAASPVIGTGTVNIAAGVIDTGGATEGIRFRKPRRKAPAPPPDTWATAWGVSAHNRIGRFSVNAGYPLHSPTPTGSGIGNSFFEIRADLYDDEILKLLETIT
jgi:hypothetical protein